MLPELDAYGYQIPSEQVRTQPIEPRDHARLFVYDTQTDRVTHDHFYNLHQHLPSGSVIVRNTTTVLPVRLEAQYADKTIEVFLLLNEWQDQSLAIPAMVNQHLRAGDQVRLADGSILLVDRQEEKRFFFTTNFPVEQLQDKLAAMGTTPIPNYLQSDHTTEATLRQRYQTVFAATGASTAAPTASLHMTEQVIDSVQQAGHRFVDISLEIGLGTFAPIYPEHMAEGRLHSEWYTINHQAASLLEQAQAGGQPIVALGTTATRALESWAMTDQYQTGQGIQAQTDIFIKPGFDFRLVEHLITNFHLPKSSLMLMVQAFLQHKKAQRPLVDLYQVAIDEGYSFYSFGDAMLIK